MNHHLVVLCANCSLIPHQRWHPGGDNKNVVVTGRNLSLWASVARVSLTGVTLPTECGCDVNGALSSVCDVTTGQCFCKENVTGRTCDQCQVNKHTHTHTCVIVFLFIA